MLHDVGSRACCLGKAELPSARVCCIIVHTFFHCFGPDHVQHQQAALSATEQSGRSLACSYRAVDGMPFDHVRWLCPSLRLGCCPLARCWTLPPYAVRSPSLLCDAPRQKCLGDSGTTANGNGMRTTPPPDRCMSASKPTHSGRTAHEGYVANAIKYRYACDFGSGNKMHCPSVPAWRRLCARDARTTD